MCVDMTLLPLLSPRQEEEDDDGEKGGRGAKEAKFKGNDTYSQSSI